MRFAFAGVLLSSLVLTGCVAGAAGKSNISPGDLPAMRWDHRPEAAVWTMSSMNVIAANDAVLAARVPADIEGWCPGYDTASLPERRAFWLGLLSATAKHESTWNPTASGGGGRYIGLMQISPATARANGCSAQSAAALKNGEANLACAIKIISRQVARDGVVAGGGNRGVGRDWGPFRVASKRADIAAWTKRQSYCEG
ncbi:MAG: transglycosylase SLT domain-containing protein [Rhodobacteraceae bacterium]|nr:transglycosylase SLT domain-containing protein [Paracoccaceae bacterium]